jgi:hypothetical protein
MYLHPTYAVTPDREPLGVLDAWMWARADKGSPQAAEAPVESVRWIEGYERVAEQAEALPDTRVVHVADREGDLLALMQRAAAMGHPADWLIHSQHNRALRHKRMLWDEAMAGESLGSIGFRCSSNPKNGRQLACYGKSPSPQSRPHSIR